MLISKAYEVEQLLKEYISIHNKRLETAGTVKSLSQKIDFGKLYEDINKVKIKFEEKDPEIERLKEQSVNFTETEKRFFDTLDEYFKALCDTVKHLCLMSLREYETSKGFLHNERRLSWSEFTELEKMYQTKINSYMELGHKLNETFQLLEKESDEVRANGSASLNYSEIVKFFLDHFNNIDSIEDVKSHFGTRLADLSKDEKSVAYTEVFSLLFPRPSGLKDYNFRFHDSNNFWGELEVDFIEGSLKNVRSQLFGEDLIANNFGLSNINEEIKKCLSEQFSEPSKPRIGPEDIPGLSTLQWVDPVGMKYITLRNSKDQFGVRSYISLAITQMDY